MAYLTLKEIKQKYEIPIPTLRMWIQKGLLEIHQIDKTKSTKIYINELDLPAFLRFRK